VHRSVTRVGVAALALGLACDHTAPFGPGQYEPRGPYTHSAPMRLTFNLGQDLAPAWMPAGSEVLYTVERLDDSTRSRCLARLPGGGGARLATLCDPDPLAADSTIVYEAAAPARDGRLAFVRGASLFRFDRAPSTRYLALATVSDPERFRVLARFLFRSPAGQLEENAADIGWVDDSTIVYLAEAWQPPPGELPAGDTLIYGLEIGLVDLRGGGAALSIVPGTQWASSVAVGDTAGVIYYTLGGDSRVFRRSLATGDVSVLFDFGSAGIARDVQVRDGRLVAVVGGQVSFAFDSTRDQFVQSDEGGVLHVVELGTGTDVATPLSDNFYRHPALDAAGHVVVEGYAFTVDDLGDTTRTTVADLWRFDVP